MKTKLLRLLAALYLILFCSSCADDKTTDWQIYTISNICSFKVPPTMEVRKSSSLNIVVNQLTTIATYNCYNCDPYTDGLKIVLQPKGIDDVIKDIDYDTNPFSSYARIIIDLHDCIENGINSSNIMQLSTSDLQQINDNEKQRTENYYKCMSEYVEQIGGFKWEGLSRIHINDIPCLKYGLVRPGIQGPVKIDSYVFYLDNNKMAEVTLAYRLDDKDIYAGDYERFIKNLVFNHPNKTNAKLPHNNVFISEPNHLQFTYSDDYEKLGINGASHMILKLSYKDTKITRMLTISVWNDCYISLKDNDIVNNCINTDNQQGIIIEKCSGRDYDIPNKTYCLKSIVKSNVAGTSLYSTIFRIVRNDKLYVVVLAQDEVDFNANNNLFDTLLKGLHIN